MAFRGQVERSLAIRLDSIYKSDTDKEKEHDHLFNVFDSSNLNYIITNKLSVARDRRYPTLRPGSLEPKPVSEAIKDKPGSDVE